MRTHDKIKEDIIALLKKSGELPTTDIALKLRQQYWKVFSLLSEMEGKEVECNPTKYFKYWRIKK